MKCTSRSEKFVDYVIGASLVLVGLVVLYVIGISRIILHSIDSHALRLYLGAPVVVLVAGLLLLRLPASDKVNTALVIASVTITLYGIELTLAIVSHDFNEQVSVDARSKAEVLKSFRAKGVRAVSAFPVQSIPLESGALLLPLGGVSNEQTVLCNEVGKWVRYVADEHGFRNPHGLYRAAGAEVVAVGDSFTHGVCVEDGKTFIGLIRAVYPMTLNLGWVGNGPLLELATLREFAEQLRPKVVLWVYYEGNDLSDLEREKKMEIVRLYLQKHFRQRLIDRTAELDQALRGHFDALFLQHEEWNHAVTDVERRLWYLRKNRWVKLITLAGLRSRMGLYRTVRNTSSSSDLETFRNILIEARDTVRVWGGQLHFVYLCEKARFDHSEYASPDREAVLSLVKELAIPTIDSYEILRDQDTLSLYQGHYSEKAQRLIASAVLTAIIRDLQLPRGRKQHLLASQPG